MKKLLAALVAVVSAQSYAYAPVPSKVVSVQAVEDEAGKSVLSLVLDRRNFETNCDTYHNQNRMYIDLSKRSKFEGDLLLNQIINASMVGMPVGLSNGSTCDSQYGLRADNVTFIRNIQYEFKQPSRRYRVQNQNNFNMSQSYRNNSEYSMRVYVTGGQQGGLNCYLEGRVGKSSSKGSQMLAAISDMRVTGKNATQQCSISFVVPPNSWWSLSSAAITDTFPPEKNSNSYYRKWHTRTWYGKKKHHRETVWNGRRIGSTPPIRISNYVYSTDGYRGGNRWNMKRQRDPVAPNGRPTFTVIQEYTDGALPDPIFLEDFEYKSKFVNNYVDSGDFLKLVGQDLVDGLKAEIAQDVLDEAASLVNSVGDDLIMRATNTITGKSTQALQAVLPKSIYDVMSGSSKVKFEGKIGGIINDTIEDERAKLTEMYNSIVADTVEGTVNDQKAKILAELNKLADRTGGNHVASEAELAALEESAENADLDVVRERLNDAVNAESIAIGNALESVLEEAIYESIETSLGGIVDDTTMDAVKASVDVAREGGGTEEMVDAAILSVLEGEVDSAVITVVQAGVNGVIENGIDGLGDAAEAAIKAAEDKTTEAAIELAMDNILGSMMSPADLSTAKGLVITGFREGSDAAKAAAVEVAVETALSGKVDAVTLATVKEMTVIALNDGLDGVMLAAEAELERLATESAIDFAVKNLGIGLTPAQIENATTRIKKAYNDNTGATARREAINIAVDIALAGQPVDVRDLVKEASLLAVTDGLDAVTNFAEDKLREVATETAINFALDSALNGVVDAGTLATVKSVVADARDGKTDDAQITAINAALDTALTGNVTPEIIAEVKEIAGIAVTDGMDGVQKVVEQKVDALLDTAIETALDTALGDKVDQATKDALMSTIEAARTTGTSGAVEVAVNEILQGKVDDAMIANVNQLVMAAIDGGMDNMLAVAEQQVEAALDNAIDRAVDDALAGVVSPETVAALKVAIKEAEDGNEGAAKEIAVLAAIDEALAGQVNDAVLLTVKELSVIALNEGMDGLEAEAEKRVQAAIDDAVGTAIDTSLAGIVDQATIDQVKAVVKTARDGDDEAATNLAIDTAIEGILDGIADESVKSQVKDVVKIAINEGMDGVLAAAEAEANKAMAEATDLAIERTLEGLISAAEIDGLQTVVTEAINGNTDAARAAAIEAAVDAALAGKVDDSVTTRVKDLMTIAANEGMDAVEDAVLDSTEAVTEIAVNLAIETALNTQVDDPVIATVQEAVKLVLREGVDGAKDVAIDTAIDNALNSYVDADTIELVQEVVDVARGKGIDGVVDQAIDAGIATVLEEALGGKVSSEVIEDVKARIDEARNLDTDFAINEAIDIGVNEVLEGVVDQATIDQIVDLAKVARTDGLSGIEAAADAAIADALDGAVNIAVDVALSEIASRDVVNGVKLVLNELEADPTQAMVDLAVDQALRTTMPVGVRDEVKVYVNAAMNGGVEGLESAVLQVVDDKIDASVNNAIDTALNGLVARDLIEEVQAAVKIARAENQVDAIKIALDTVLATQIQVGKAAKDALRADIEASIASIEVPEIPKL